MAGKLQTLLGNESVSIGTLEIVSGNAGRDIQLIFDITTRANRAMQRLGLDPNDTTSDELRATLSVRAKRDSTLLAEVLDGDPTDVADMNQKIIRAMQQFDIPRQCWVLKRPVAKKILKSVPPKSLMKRLHYRSIDSMLKHEPIDELYVAVRFSEDEAWRNRFEKQLASVQPKDFESRDISVSVLDSRYLGMADNFLLDKGHYVLHAKEVGALALAPTEYSYVENYALGTILSVLRYINEIRLYSTYFKLKQVASDFGAAFTNVLFNDPEDTVNLSGHPVHWRSVHKHLSTQSEVGFSPHIQSEDLSWQSAEEQLACIMPEFEFWIELSYIGVIYDNEVVSCNILDILSEQQTGQASTYFMRRSLLEDLYARYMGSEQIKSQVIKQLDITM